MTEIVMPRLSDTMEEGTILRWLKGDGETVQRGEELVEIETDKATMIYESDQSGTLALIAAEGDTLAVGEPIALVGDGAAAAAPPTAEAVPAPEPHEEPEGGATPTLPPAAISEERRRAGRPGAGRAREGIPAGQADRPAGRRRPRRPDGQRARRADRQGRRGGPRRRRSRRAPRPESRPAPATAAPEAVATAKGQTTEVELNRLQQTVARRMAESKATIPEFTIQMDVDMEACVTLRAELKRMAGQGPSAAGESTPTYNDMVVKACALALREHPTANGSYRDGRLQLHSRINVGVAVAAEGALVVPTVFDADEKSLGEIARETRALAERVRAATITPPELGGGTFTVSNLGMFGIRSFTAIINPPQAAIMSVGALEQRAVVAGGQDQLEPTLVARHMLTLTLVCDHRILFGAEAAGFLQRVRELLQTPAALTL